MTKGGMPDARRAARDPSETLTATAVLRRNYMFRGLPERALAGIAALSSRKVHQKGSIIFSQGDSGDALYGVASGRVRISASGAGGREVFLNIM
jgi:CRP/FNR family transcriptional regulator, cyclic AMP receptor protein